MLADLLQSGIEDINSLEKSYMFAEVGRMAAEESSLMKAFWRAAKAANIQGFFIFYFQVLRLLLHFRPAQPQFKIKNCFEIF